MSSGGDLYWRKKYKTLSSVLRQHDIDFFKPTSNLSAIQNEILQSLLHENSSTEFGKKSRFSEISSYEDFAKRCPITTYDDYEKEFSSGNVAFSSSQPALGYTLSSGSRSSRKVIPITEHLALQFCSALSPWLLSLFETFPEVTTGPGYWIIGPAADLSSFSHLKLCSDESYFPCEVWKSLREVLIQPPSLGKDSCFDSWAFVTLLNLLLYRDLSWISAWSPTLLLQLMGSLPRLAPSLIDCLSSGVCATGANQLTPNEVAAVNLLLAEKSGDCSETLGRLRVCQSNGPGSVWPNLSLISCWGDSWARLSLQQLQGMFPGVVIQPKGLLATEGVVSIPIYDGSPAEISYMLAYRSHFFEFLDTETHRVVLAHQIVEGREYRVLITTGGGVYRYDLGDLIEVSGWLRGIPCLRFIGKDGGVSDMCGEKLSEQHVTAALQSVSKILSVNLRGAHLLPIDDGNCLYYGIVIPMYTGDTQALIRQLEIELCKNPHYYQARRLSQLSEPQVVEKTAKDAASIERGEILSTSKESCLRISYPKRSVV